MERVKRNTKIIIGIIVAVAIVGGVGLTVLLPKTPEIQIGNWWEYSSGLRVEVVGEEMVGEHDCWKVKSYFPDEEEGTDTRIYDYRDKKNLGIWKKDIRTSIINSEFEMKNKSTATYQPEPLAIRWPVKDRYYDTGITSRGNIKTDIFDPLLKSLMGNMEEPTKRSSVVSIRQTYVGKEQITVPAGTFVCEHYIETNESDSGSRTWNIWFSPDVWNEVRLDTGEGEIRELVDYHK